MKDDTAVFHVFAWNPVTVQYDDWKGMGTRVAIAERSFEAQGPVHYCPKEWLMDGWLDKPKGRQQIKSPPCYGSVIRQTTASRYARALSKQHRVGRQPSLPGASTDGAALQAV